MSPPVQVSKQALLYLFNYVFEPQRVLFETNLCTCVMFCWINSKFDQYRLVFLFGNRGVVNDSSWSRLRGVLTLSTRWIGPSSRCFVYTEIIYTGVGSGCPQSRNSATRAYEDSSNGEVLKPMAPIRSAFRRRSLISQLIYTHSAVFHLDSTRTWPLRDRYIFIRRHSGFSCSVIIFTRAFKNTIRRC